MGFWAEKVFMVNLNCTITIAKEELKKAELEAHLIKIANKWGARFESSFAKHLRLQAKKIF